MVEKANQGIAPLDARALQALRNLVKRVHEHKGPWSVMRGGERSDDGSVQMRWVEMSDVCADAMDWM